MRRSNFSGGVSWPCGSAPSDFFHTEDSMRSPLSEERNTIPSWRSNWHRWPRSWGNRKRETGSLRPCEYSLASPGGSALGRALRPAKRSGARLGLLQLVFANLDVGGPRLAPDPNAVDTRAPRSQRATELDDPPGPIAGAANLDERTDLQGRASILRGTPAPFSKASPRGDTENSPQFIVHDGIKRPRLPLGRLFLPGRDKHSLLAGRVLGGRPSAAGFT
jgi:hypothetical protein